MRTGTRHIWLLLLLGVGFLAMNAADLYRQASYDVAANCMPAQVAQH